MVRVRVMGLGFRVSVRARVRGWGMQKYNYIH